MIGRQAFQALARPNVLVAPRIAVVQQRIPKRFASSGVVDMTVRDALNAAMAEEYVWLFLGRCRENVELIRSGGG